MPKQKVFTDEDRENFAPHETPEGYWLETFEDLEHYEWFTKPENAKCEAQKALIRRLSGPKWVEPKPKTDEQSVNQRIVELEQQLANAQGEVAKLTHDLQQTNQASTVMSNDFANLKVKYNKLQDSVKKFNASHHHNNQLKEY